MAAGAETKGIGLLRLAVAMPVLIGCGVLAGFMPNLPWQDDYNAILQFCLNMRALPTVASKLLYVIAAQHNDYKLIFEHVVVLAQLGLLHHLNFTALIVIGNAFVPAIFYMAWKMCRFEGVSERQRLMLFLPVGLVVFSLNYAETLDWAMTGLQNVPVVFFSMAALYLLTGQGSRGRFWMACAGAVLAACSSVNGFLLAPVGLGVLWLRGARVRAAVWGMIFLPELAAYLYRYRVNLPTMAVPLWTKPVFLLAVLGGAAPDRALAVAGLVLVAVWIGALRAGYYRANPYAVAVSMWVVGTGVMIAIGRGNYGVGGAHAARYKIYADLMLVVCYLFGASRVLGAEMSAGSKRLWYGGALIAALLLFVHGEMTAWRLLKERRADLRTGLAAYRADPGRNSPMYLSDPGLERMQAKPDEDARRIMTESIANGLYVPPQ